MAGPSWWSQALGLVLFVVLVLGARYVHRAYQAWLSRRVQRAAAAPLPGRVRDMVSPPDRRVS